jgi:hypothetical protein
MQRFVKLDQLIQKSDELGIIWGYASVADIVDLQGDVVPQEELVRAVYEFMESYYAEQATIRENHGDEPEVVLVESTFHFLAGRLRWYVGVKLLTDELRQAARDGEISGFSIGGSGQAEKI